ncbi:MAG: M48 family metallopeptidase, partial [Muribaculaceae bacterium]|nr:M48 family metallopeptidase [Muribaculaceae bacterium]
MQRQGIYKGLSVMITQKSVKRINLRVVADEPHVRVSLPLSVPIDEALRFIDTNREWIDGAIERVKARRQLRDEVEPALTRAQALEFARAVHSRLQYWARLMDVDYSRVAIRTMKTRWGSCSADGRICINRRLAHYPPHWLDYVVVHELAHRIQINHSSQFWAIVSRFYPRWKIVRSEMRKLTKQE